MVILKFKYVDLLKVLSLSKKGEFMTLKRGNENHKSNWQLKIVFSKLQTRGLKNTANFESNSGWKKGLQPAAVNIYIFIIYSVYITLVVCVCMCVWCVCVWCVCTARRHRTANLLSFPNHPAASPYGDTVSIHIMYFLFRSGFESFRWSWIWQWCVWPSCPWCLDRPLQPIGCCVPAPRWPVAAQSAPCAAASTQWRQERWLLWDWQI